MTDHSIDRRNLVLGVGASLALPGVGLAAGKPRVVIKTALGSIVVELENQKAPLTTANFLRYVDAKSFDGGSFYRAARSAGRQDKDGTVVGQPPPNVRPFPPIRHESTTKTGLKHLNGTISLGRFAPGTATNNFFICVGDQPYLDAHPEDKSGDDNLGYAAFGQVISGMPLVERILAMPTAGATKFKDQRGQWLTKPVIFTSVRRG
jgi:peptidyl-prolyl cis-trans isomerase A (cyclophilin A)